MTTRLHDVLNDIAGEVSPPPDLTAQVSSRARRIRWGRRAAAGSAALTVAATVGLVTIVLPSWDDGRTGFDDLPQTSPTVAPLADETDLDAAVPGTVDAATAVYLVSHDDGSVVPVAVDAKGAAITLDVPVPPGIELLQLSTDGTRAFMLGVGQVTVVDLTTGQVAYTDVRDPKQPYGMSPDGSSLLTFERDPDAVVDLGVASLWRLERVDVATGEVTDGGYATQRNSIESTLWPAPDGQTLFMRFHDSARDQRTHRIDLTTGTVTFSEVYTALPIERLVWSADATVLLAEMSSSVRVLEPTAEIGRVTATLRKTGTLTGFHGNDQLVWWRPVAGGVELQETDLSGAAVRAPRLVTVTGTVLRVATALG